MTVTSIRRQRLRGTGRTNPQPPAQPNTTEWYEQQAVKWPEHADDLLAEAAKLRNQTQAA